MKWELNAHQRVSNLRRRIHSAASICAFYLSLAIGALSLLWDRSMAARMHYIFAACGLIVMITLAAFWNIRQFDFASHPGGLVYIGIYLVVGFVSLLYFIFYGTGRVIQGST